MQAALTGHLVLATLHTNNAAAAVTRLLDMGVEDYLVASTVRGILAQRLVRRCCPTCSGNDIPETPNCPTCNQTGYSGRTTIAEILTVTKDVRDLIQARASEDDIERAGRRSGMRLLTERGQEKVAGGITTAAEILRVTRSSR